MPFKALKYVCCAVIPLSRSCKVFTHIFCLFLQENAIFLIKSAEYRRSSDCTHSEDRPGHSDSCFRQKENRCSENKTDTKAYHLSFGKSHNKLLFDVVQVFRNLYIMCHRSSNLVQGQCALNILLLIAPVRRMVKISAAVYPISIAICIITPSELELSDVTNVPILKPIHFT